ncbi:putative exocyst complex component Exo70, cullin repeat-like-containing domain superfamily [Helianthus annuus]|nr:putative exocyst complex component Exo70, cullin repeat-like-containing domain superfamily [Helianthus annuus]KAJ0454953.1 putative exocyst complex component Exo70, cullin repeat-like-containing domain superfamily [Helianthus annuus]
MPPALPKFCFSPAIFSFITFSSNHNQQSFIISMEDQDQDQKTNLDNEPTSVSSHDHKLYQQIDTFISILHDQPDSSSPPEIVEPVQNFADLFDAMLAAFESGSKRCTVFKTDEPLCFLESVDRTAKLIKSFCRFDSDQIYAVAINRLSGIQQRAMSIMEDEFKSILDDYQTSYDRDKKAKTDETKTIHLSSSLSNVEDSSELELPDQDQAEPQLEKDEFLGYSDALISDLNKLVNGLIQGGHETECSELYFLVRRNAMEQNLKAIEFEKFSIDEMQKMQWDLIEKEISSWIIIFKRFCNSLLPSEKRLADDVFCGHTAISNRLFSNLTRNILLCFLNFAEAVMMTKRSAEKLFKFLDIYETLQDNIPTVEKLIISGEWLPQLKSSAVLIRYMLGESIFMIFIELENSIKSDTSKTPVPSGAVHPLTRYTMNYLNYACEYSDTLEQIFRDHQEIGADFDDLKSQDHQHNYESNEAGSGSESGSGSPFQAQLTKIMDQLDTNLEAKSRLYKDPSLSLIFMMNNGRYILQKTKGTGEMRTLLGDPWVRKRSSDLQNYHTCYKRETWTNVLQCLSHEGLSANGKVKKPVLKERFKSFNAMFDEIHKTQTAWVVSDEQLQSELRVSISAIVIPAYRSFMGRFSQVFTPGRQTEKYIKYQPEDVETCIEELFDGNAAQQGKKR